MAAFTGEVVQLTTPELYDKYVLGAEPCVLTPRERDALFAEFRDHWGLGGELIMVGSAVLGFSIKPARRFELFDFNESDLDVAVIDAELFADIWQDVHEYVRRNQYWRQIDRFKEYLFDGWIRPDVLPPGQIHDSWWEFFAKVQRSRQFGDFKIRAALYPSRYYLEQYQHLSIEQCRDQMRLR